MRHHVPRVHHDAHGAFRNLQRQNGLVHYVHSELVGCLEHELSDALSVGRMNCTFPERYVTAGRQSSPKTSVDPAPQSGDGRPPQRTHRRCVGRRAASEHASSKMSCHSLTPRSVKAAVSRRKPEGNGKGIQATVLVPITPLRTGALKILEKDETDHSSRRGVSV